MTQDTDKVADTLAGLHQTLSQLSQVDERTQSLLRDLLPDIGRLLARPDLVNAPASARAATDSSPHHRLEDLAVGFEADHPALAANLRQIVDALGKGGL